MAPIFLDLEKYWSIYCKIPFSFQLINSIKDLLSTRKPLVAATIRTPRHIGKNRSQVRVRPECPLQIDSGSGFSRCMQWSRLRSNYAFTANTTTLEVDRCYIFDRAVRSNLARDAWGSSATPVWISIRLIKLRWYLVS